MGRGQNRTHAFAAEASGRFLARESERRVVAMKTSNRLFRSLDSPLLGWLLTLFSILAFPQTSSAITPDSPEVQRLIKSGFKFLESTHGDSTLGGNCLVGLAFLKNGASPDHPKVVYAVKACQAAVGKSARDSKFIYSYSLAIIFLCELDPYRYRSEIENFLVSIRDSQKYHGGWGYPELSTGYTSVTQYAILCCW